MESIADQSPEREIGSMALIGFGESSEAESIRDHKAIDIVSLLLISVSFFEVADKLRVKLIDKAVKGIQILTLRPRN
jgi:hypothetical protein